MDILRMATSTTRRKIGYRRRHSNLMPDLSMTPVTLDLMIGDMDPVEVLRGVFRLQEFGFTMAFDALCLGNRAIPLIDTRMTLDAKDPSIDVLFVIEFDSFYLKIAFWLDMAGTTFRTREAVLLTLSAGLIKVADKTISLCHRKMRPLHNLGMATRTTEFFPPPQFFEVLAMIESHVLENHLSVHVFLPVASLLKASGIADFCMGFRGPLARNKHDQRDLSIPPFSLQMVEQSRFIMTLGTTGKIVG
jgi:hypothetical protein